MNILFVVLLICLEIALVILTAAKKDGKAIWRRNRAIARAIEFGLLLGIVLLPIIHMKWRYTGALILLGILLLIAGLCWLINRKKTDGPVKTGKAIASAVLSVVMILFALTPAFLFTNYNGIPTTGEYEVRECSAILTDESRTDPFETDGSPREVPVHFYYPDTEGSFPLVIFSHGAFGYYQSNYSTFAELASNGYIVASLDHPHHAFFTKDTDGKTVVADFSFISDAVSLNEKSAEDAYALFCEWMALRIPDMNFVIDTVKTAKNSGSLDDCWHTDEADTVLAVLGMTDVAHIGLMGHSMGGAAAVGVGRMRSDIDAVIDLDGTMLSEITGLENGKARYNDKPYPVPVLDFSKQSDYIDGEMICGEAGFELVNDYEIGRAVDGKKMIFDHVGHMDFTDLPLFSPVLSRLLGSGDADKTEFITQINSLVLNWFDCYLKNEGTLAS